jgi:porphobilinogen synthase
VNWLNGAFHVGKLVQDLPNRPRRNRRSATVRAAIRENSISPDNFILPLFIHEEDKDQEIPSMPGVKRLSYRNGLTDFVSEARSYGVNSVVIFPKVRCMAGPFKG